MSIISEPCTPDIHLLYINIHIYICIYILVFFLHVNLQQSDLTMLCVSWFTPPLFLRGEGRVNAHYCLWSIVVCFSYKFWDRMLAFFFLLKSIFQKVHNRSFLLHWLKKKKHIDNMPLTSELQQCYHGATRVGGACIPLPQNIEQEVVTATRPNQ